MTQNPSPSRREGNPSRREGNPSQREGNRGADGPLRELVGGGASQLSANKAARARDINRPTQQELDEAERDVVIVRRNWTPST